MIRPIYTPIIVSGISKGSGGTFVCPTDIGEKFLMFPLFIGLALFIFVMYVFFLKDVLEDCGVSFLLKIICFIISSMIAFPLIGISLYPVFHCIGE